MGTENNYTLIKDYCINLLKHVYDMREIFAWEFMHC